MKNFWGIVNHVVKQADIILLVLDARFPEQTDNPELIEKAGEKDIIYVLNKADLVERKTLERLKKKYPNCIYISSKEHQGTTMLLHKILEIAQGQKVSVGVVGYPNTGKSSVINALKGRKSASTSPHSGHTKAKQLIKITDNVYLIDTPGVLPYMERDKIKLAMIGAEDFTKTKDPDLAAMELIKNKIKKIKQRWRSKYQRDSQNDFTRLAKRENYSASLINLLMVLSPRSKLPSLPQLGQTLSFQLALRLKRNLQSLQIY